MKRILCAWALLAWACSFPVFGQQQDQNAAPPPASAVQEDQQPQVQGRGKKPSNKPQMSRIHAIEDGKGGGISELSEFAQDPDREVRLEAIRVIIKIGGAESLPPLIAATHDADPEVRSKSTDGLVNYYLPGYVSGVFKRMTRVFSSRNDAIIDDDVNVREDVAQAVTTEINFGNEMPPRANAALAAGVLRVKTAVSALSEALRSKNNNVIFQSLNALQKIHDSSAGPSVIFLLHDLDERIQSAALETVGLLGTREAAPDLRYAVQNARSGKIRRSALAALAMLAFPEDRALFRQYAQSSELELRVASLEGLGRVREPEDTQLLQANYDQPNADWRIHLAGAFALVSEGNVSNAEFSPLPYLVENLNSSLRQGTAQAYLKELMHHDDVRRAIVPLVPQATKAQKMALCWIFAYSHSEDLLPALTQLGNDRDGEISIAAKRAAHVLQTQQTRPAP